MSRQPNHSIFSFSARAHRACSLVLAGALAVATVSAVGAQEFRGSQQDQQACTDDVFRLCGEFVPDETRIIACMKAKKAQLSPACHAVFTRDDPPPAPAKTPKKTKKRKPTPT